MFTADTFAFSGVVEYGVMIELPAAKMLVMSVSLIVVDCATISDSARDVIVSLRSMETPCAEFGGAEEDRQDCRRDDAELDRGCAALCRRRARRGRVSSFCNRRRRFI